MRTVQVYRLWEDKTWDLVDIEVEDTPWRTEVVESRACTQAWKNIQRFGGVTSHGRCMRTGLYTPLFDEV